MFDPSTEPDPGIMAFLAATERPALYFAGFVPGLVLLFWLMPPLGAVAPEGWNQMTPASATGFLLVTASLLLSLPRSSARSQRLATGLALVAAIFGITILVLDILGTGGSGLLQLPAPQSAAAFMVASTCLILMHFPSVPRALVEGTAFLFLATLLFILGGILFHAMSFVGVPDGRLTSPQGLLCLTAIAYVISGRLALRKGWFAILADIGAGSRMLRIMLPAVVIVPFALFAAVGYVYESGTMPVTVTRALFAPLVVLGIFGLIALMAVRINRLERGLRHQSVTDHLTKVLNKRGFAAVSDYIARSSARAGTDLVLVFFDLDGLKKVNDTLGHEAGSRLIRRFAELMVENFRKSDVIARIGGDEFVVLAVGSRETALELTGRLDRAVTAENATTGEEFTIAYSSGFALVEPGDPHPIEDAMSRADGFMYEQKRSKKAAVLAAAPTPAIPPPAPIPAREGGEWQI